MAEQNGLNWSQAKVDKLLEQVLNGEIDEYNLPVELYYAIAQKLKDALYKGYGGSLSEFEGEPLELLQELRENLYMFSAAKTYQQTLELTDLLINEDGTIATKKEFIDGAQAIYDQYNKNWLSTEYETAITSGQSAYAWKDIEETKDVFPYVIFSAVNDANTTEECIEMDGKVFDVDDPILDSCTPPLHWHCFKPETLILTDCGYFRIDSVNLNYKVIGGSGNERNITAIHINNFSGKMCNIFIKDASISSTKNHRFLTLQGWKSAEKISAGDIIIQQSKVGFFNVFIMYVNNIYALTCYCLMSLHRQREPATCNTLNSNSSFGQININELFIYKFIAYTINTLITQPIKNGLFVFGKWRVKLALPLRGIVKSFKGVCMRPSLNIFVKHWVKFSHSFSGIRARNSDVGIWHALSRFFKHVRCGLSPFGIINPLSFNCLAAPSWLKAKGTKPTVNATHLNAPFRGNLSETKHVDEIHGVEGFSNGAPLDKFNSLFSFRFNSFFHNEYCLVKKNVEIDYTGQIYNLSVDIDETYTTNVGIVHNCRSALLKTDEDKGVLTRSESKELQGHVEEHMQDLFKNNPGKTGEVFNKDHDYFNVPRKDCILCVSRLSYQI